jgi:hypothetical protein
MSDNAKQIENAILVTLPPNAILTEPELGLRVEQFRQIFPIDDSARDTLLRRLHAKLSIRMDVGVALVEVGHTPWLLARRPTIDPFYWERYSKYLASLGWPSGVISTVDTVTRCTNAAGKDVAWLLATCSQARRQRTPRSVARPPTPGTG